MFTDSNTAAALMDGWKIEVREPWYGSPKLDDGNVEENQLGFLLVSPSGRNYSRRVRWSPVEGMKAGGKNPVLQSSRRTMALAMEAMLENILKNEKERDESSATSKIY